MTNKSYFYFFSLFCFRKPLPSNDYNSSVIYVFVCVEILRPSSPLGVMSNAYTLIITKTYLYIFEPLKPHFYTVKLGFTGVYTIFLISAQKHRLWVLVKTAWPRRCQRVPTINVLSRNIKNIKKFYLKMFLFWM